MKRNSSFGALGASILVIALMGFATLMPRDGVSAQSNPTLDAAEQAIRQATRAAQQTRDAREQELTLQRAEQTRVAGEATRVYAATRAALDTYATRQAIDTQATRAALESHATATTERQRRDATATRLIEHVNATRSAGTQTAIALATREQHTRAASHATATLEAIRAQATRVAMQRAAEHEERFFAATLAFVFVLGIAVVAFAVVAIRALWRTPHPIVIETTVSPTPATYGEATHGAPVQTDLPPTRVVCDPAAAQRITEILEFQERGDDESSPNDSA